MSESNKAVLRRIYDELFSGGRLDVADDVVAADCVEHTPPPGLPSDDVRAALKEFTVAVRAAFPDVRFTAGNIVAEGDLVAANWTAEGTHLGDFMGTPPTGERVFFEGVDLVRVVDGRCTDHWGFDNSMVRIVPREEGFTLGAV